MKYLKTIIAIFSICAGLISCTEEKVEEKTYSILFLENPVMVGSNGGTCTCSFASDHQWTADAVSKWITDVTVTDGEVSFTVEANPTEDTRNGKIRFTVSGDDYTQDLTIRQLVDRVAFMVSPESLFESDGAPAEVILALSGDVEGETTSFYIYRQISRYGVKVSSLARGLGFGDDLEYADELTLGRSIVNRQVFKP